MTVEAEYFGEDDTMMNCEQFIQELEHTESLTIDKKVSSVPKSILSSYDLLALYYTQYFPFKMILRWLSYGNERQYLANREFSFTLANEVYIRYLSFDSAASFAAKLQKELPVKIDIGAVYSSRPTERKTIAGANFKPVEHELVFDIDMTDYDDVRSCCQGKSVCRMCWRFITVAVKIIDFALRDDFGFEHILWVFSGRRGIHCWVADARARQMSTSSRKALVSYLELLKVCLLDPWSWETPQLIKNREALIHDVNRIYHWRSIEIIDNFFPATALQEQDFLRTKSARQKFINSLSHEVLRKGVEELWSDKNVGSTEFGPKDYWKSFEKFIDRLSLEENPAYARIPLEVKLAFLYPRLDSNVSVQLNHLLKSPFCVHPETGKLPSKVCIPLDPLKVDEFDPSKVLTIQELCLHSGNDHQGSPLAPSLEIFDGFIKSLEEARRKALSETRGLQEKSLSF